MKAKILKNNDEQYGKELKVRRMNYDKIILNYPDRIGFREFDYNDVEIISEGEIDEFIVKNRDLLKIKLNRGISIMFYKFLLSELEREILDDVVNINLLKDKYKVNKRGIWEKEIVLMVNKKIIFKIEASGMNFKREGYSISIEELSKEEFLDGAIIEMDRIKKEIKIREIMLSRYGEAINDIENKEKNNSIKLLK
ncbi:MAG: hypothetical protein ACRC2K_02420 [Clostridium sp.]